MGTEYNSQFFDMIRVGCQRSAAAVAPIVLHGYPAKTVVDVGCGEGHWGRAFADQGCEVLGIDGDYVQAPVIAFRPADLTEPIPDDVGTFDLAVCLEVAEHLPTARADGLIEDLCRLAPVVLFSAAIPGQGGVGHLNERWPAYWVKLFEAQGFECSGALRWQIWDDGRIENWYRQNLIVARGGDAPLLPQWFRSPLTPVWPVVHPVLYDARRA